MEKDNCQAVEDCIKQGCEGKTCSGYQSPILGQHNPELLALESMLPTLIDSEQDDTLNGYLCDCADAIQNYLSGKRAQEQTEFDDEDVWTKRARPPMRYTPNLLAGDYTCETTFSPSGF